MLSTVHIQIVQTNFSSYPTRPQERRAIQKSTSSHCPSFAECPLTHRAPPTLPTPSIPLPIQTILDCFLYLSKYTMRCFPWIFFTLYHACISTRTHFSILNPYVLLHDNRTSPSSPSLCKPGGWWHFLYMMKKQ